MALARLADTKVKPTGLAHNWAELSSSSLLPKTVVCFQQQVPTSAAADTATFCLMSPPTCGRHCASALPSSWIRPQSGWEKCAKMLVLSPVLFCFKLALFTPQPHGWQEGERVKPQLQPSVGQPVVASSCTSSSSSTVGSYFSFAPSLLPAMEQLSLLHWACC